MLLEVQGNETAAMVLQPTQSVHSHHLLLFLGLSFPLQFSQHAKCPSLAWKVLQAVSNAEKVAKH